MSGLPCPDCFKGKEHIGNPRGTVATIHGIPTYIASPPEGITPKGIIVHITDAFGWEFTNNRILCDHYAERGNFLVYMPDFMNGHAMSFTFATLLDQKIFAPLPWLETIFLKPIYLIYALSIVIPFIFYVRQSVCKPRIFNFFAALRSSPPPFPTSNLKIGVAGFCWGGLYAVYLAADTPSSRVHAHSSPDELRPLIDAAFTAHPSLLKIPRDIENVNLPLSVAIGEEDLYMKAPLVVKMKDILEGKGKGHEVNIMPGAKHGFAIRNDPDNKLQMECAEKAEVQAVEWFGKWLS